MLLKNLEGTIISHFKVNITHYTVLKQIYAFKVIKIITT